MVRLPLFRTTSLTTTILYYLAGVGLIMAIHRGAWQFLPWAIAIHITTISLFSAVTHRYFCHRAYDAHPFVMWLLSIVPVLYSYATPIQWAAMHTAHHAYADTERDPHGKGWIGLFHAAYKTPPMKFAAATKWFRDIKHQFIYDNALVLVTLYHATLLVISIDAFLWLGLTPMFTLSLCNGLHRVFSHTKQGCVTNRWYLEFIAPMGGEWIHDEHHTSAKKIKFSNHWYEFDTGSVFVKLLSKKVTV